MLSLTLSLALFASPVASAQGGSSCSSAWSADALTARLDAAEASFRELDVSGFGLAMDDVVLQLPCLDELATPELAARTHVMLGLRQYVSGEEERAARAFAAARRANPEHQLPAGLLPEGHEVYDLFVSIPTENARTEELYPPEEGELRFDGAASLARTTDWPTLMQHVGPAQDVQLTRYLLPGDSLPDYGARIPEPPPIAALPFIRSKAQLGFASGAVAGALATGGLYLAAANQEGFFDGPIGPRTSEADAQLHRSRANGLTVACGVTGALTLGAGGLAVLSGRW